MGGGLGDIIVALPVINALVAQGKTVLVMRTPRQLGFESLIRGLAGTIKEADLVARALPPDERYINLRGHRLQTDYFWGGPEFERDYPQFRINDILKEMCKDFGIEADFNHLKPFEYNKLPALCNTIVFVPGTTVDSKTWASRNWLELKNRLESQGFAICMLGQPDYCANVKELNERGIKILPTPEIYEAVDILSSARAVVSVDTGLMHLAIHQGTPTVCLFQDPIFHRSYANAYPLFSKHCAAICVENRMAAKPQDTTEYPEWNWRTGSFDFCLVPEMERCINSITVDQVMQELAQAIPLSSV